MAGKISSSRFDDFFFEMHNIKKKIKKQGASQAALEGLIMIVPKHTPKENRQTPSPSSSEKYPPCNLGNRLAISVNQILLLLLFLFQHSSHQHSNHCRATPEILLLYELLLIAMDLRLQTRQLLAQIQREQESLNTLALALTAHLPVPQQRPTKTAVHTHVPTLARTDGSLSVVRPLSREDAGPMLGYDWICGMLDPRHPLEAQPDAFFDELAVFRRLNRDACESPYESSMLMPRPVAPALAPAAPPPPQPVRLDARLFPTQVPAGPVTLVTVPLRTDSRPALRSHAP